MPPGEFCVWDLVGQIVLARAFGGPEVLSVEVEDPGEPGPDTALVEVRATGVNPIDVKAYSGALGADPATLPMRLGAEAAGVVRAVGPSSSGVSPVAVADEVIAFPAAGAYASELLVGFSALTAKPASLDFPAASGLMLTGVTAWHLLSATALAANETVLVHAGAGGVGLMVIQLARHRGARVIATASTSHHELLREFGAQPVEYGTGLADRVRDLAPGGVDVALDLVGSDEAVDACLQLVADRSRIATIAAFDRGGRAGIKVLGSGPGGDPGTRIREQARPELAKLAGEGVLRVVVSEIFPLARAADAHRVIRAGHTTGKIVLIP